MYPGQTRTAYTVKYEADDTSEDLEEEEIRKLLVVTAMPERKELAGKLAQAFKYIQERFTGACSDVFDCSAMYHVFRLVQVFNPQFAARHADPQWVDDLARITPLAVPPDQGGIDFAKLKLELPAYLVAAQSASFNCSDVDSFTDGVLDWWRQHGKLIPTWACAARVVFCLSPNSASCERVFALLRLMYGDAQTAALSDQLQAALMSRYNKRTIG